MSEIRVLIVEDEVLIAEDIADSLSAIDYKVAGIAYSVDKALMLLNSQHPDIVLLDIQLMGEKSGIDLAKIISDKYRIPFVFLTSFADKNTVDQAKKTMPYGYVVKPFTAATLKEKIDKIFERIEAA